MGLVQRAIEASGIPTVSISILREITEKVRPPRAIYLHWPFGHPLGEPFNVAQQLTVLDHAFDLLYTAQPGELRALDYRWRRHSYSVPAKWNRGRKPQRRDD